MSISGRRNSLAFEPIYNKKKGDYLRDPHGEIIYRSIPVPPKKGYLFCTECHDYKKFKNLPDKYGNVLKRCVECGISINDFHIKTANRLWDKKYK